MAQQDYSGILVLGAIGAALYLAYEKGLLAMIGLCPSGYTVGASDVFPLCGPTSAASPITAAPPAVAVAVTPPSATPISVVPPPVVKGPPPPNPLAAPAGSLAQLLIAQAGGDSFNPDQWAYFYAQLRGRSAVPATAMSQILSSGNISDRTQPITAETFAALAQGAGLSGFGYAGIPTSMIHGGW